MTIETKQLSRGGIWLIIIGMTLLLGSCLPAGLTLKRVMDAEVIHTQPLLPGEWIETGVIDVDATRMIQVAVTMQVSAETPDSDDDPVYRFPFSYELIDEQGRTIGQQQLSIVNDSGSRTTTNRLTVNDRTRFDLETGFDKLRVPALGRLRVRARLMPDEDYHAQIDNPSLLVYDKVSRHLGTVLVGVGVWIIGALVLMTGMVLALLGASEKGQSEAIDTEDQRVRNLAIWCHLSSLAVYLGIPFGNLLGVLIFWLINRDQAAFIDWHGRESLNFQITLVIYSAITLLLSFILIGLFLFPLLALFHVVLTVIAAVRASEGKEYHYPFTLRLIK